MFNKTLTITFLSYTRESASKTETGNKGKKKMERQDEKIDEKKLEHCRSQNDPVYPVPLNISLATAALYGQRHMTRCNLEQVCGICMCTCACSPG